MLMYVSAIICGLVLLIWSADRFIDGAAAVARYAGMPLLLIGMVVVGFGTSAPEMVISALSSLQGNPGLALGNAYGSNISNIALILGTTAVVYPITVHSQVLHKEIPVLILVTLLAAYQLWDGYISAADAWVLLVVFACLMGWSIRQGLRNKGDALGEDVVVEISSRSMSLKMALWWLLVGLILLIVSSRMLVWGAVAVAQSLGVSDLIIGLTIVAVGTSLPELASSLSATRKGSHDIALGNVMGSNLFNTLAVVGIAGTIHPMAVDPIVLSRDVVVMGALTLALFVMGYGFRGPARISRGSGFLLLSVYFTYTGWLVYTIVDG
jgi:cation:H+ antiporter